MFGCDCCCLSSFVYLVGVLTIASKIFPFLMKKLKGDKTIELQEKNYKKDVVYLYQFNGTPTASSCSPFCVKTEAFLRLHKIQFERRNTFSGRGRNGQVPFIELNGEHYADSQIIIRRLTQIFKLKTYPDETSAAVGHAIDRLLDNHFFNLRLMATKGVSFMLKAMDLGVIPAIAVKLFGGLVDRKVQNRVAVSIGKFKESEYNELLKNDLAQIQTILGNKKYLLAEEPTVVDCTAFGQLGSAYFAVPSKRHYFHDLLDSSEFALLKEYLERTKSRIFGNEFCDNK